MPSKREPKDVVYAKQLLSLKKARDVLKKKRAEKKSATKKPKKKSAMAIRKIRLGNLRKARAAKRRMGM